MENENLKVERISLNSILKQIEEEHAKQVQHSAKPQAPKAVIHASEKPSKHTLTFGLTADERRRVITGISHEDKRNVLREILAAKVREAA